MAINLFRATTDTGREKMLEAMVAIKLETETTENAEKKKS